MMAAGSSKFTAWFSACVLLSLLPPVRAGNETCVDGTYEHDGRSCCRCGAGLYVEKHCTTNQQPGCKACASDTYSSHANNQESCEPCTSCSQPNANLEEDEPCTPARNTKCRCKTGYYCSSGTETCRICHPCKECGDVGIKIECTAKNNTVCNDKIEGGSNTGIIVGIIVSIVLVIGLVLLAFFCKKRYDKGKIKRTSDQQPNGNANDPEMQPINAPIVNLQLHLPDIVEVIGWTDMRDIALRSNILQTIIQACERNHPRDTQEQTRELLQIWVERKGREASRILIELLESTGRRGKADSVRDILSRPSQA